MALSLARVAVAMALLGGVAGSLECTGLACSMPMELDDSILLQHSAHRALAVQSATATDGPNCLNDPDCLKAVGLMERAVNSADAAQEDDAAESCHLTPGVSDGCPLSEMTHGVPNLVYPGGSAICIDNSPYAFQVYPRSSRKLVLFFQGGGVCVDFNSTFGDNPSCQQQVIVKSEGIFDASEESPFEDHTVVSISYCSGDFFLGNTTARFNDPNGQPVLQMGYWNAKSAVDWALAHFGQLDSLVVAGCSAGAIAVQSWSAYILKLWEGKVSDGKAVVIADSAVPAGVVTTIFHLFGSCSLPIFTAEVREKCMTNQGISYMDTVEETLKSFPSVPYAMLSSKTDSTQISFLNLLGPLIHVDPVDEVGFTALMNSLFDELNKWPNFVSYIVDGSSHCFLPEAWLQTTDTRGIDMAAEPHDPCQVGHHVPCPVSGNMCSGAQCCPIVSGVADSSTFPCPSAPNDFHGCEHHTKISNCLRRPPSLVDWVRDDLLGCQAVEGVASECTGELVLSYEEGATYCSAQQAGKVFRF